MARSIRRGFKKLNPHWGRRILAVSLASFVFWPAQGAFASDGNQCADSLLLSSTPTLRAPQTPVERQEDVERTIRGLADLRLRLDLAKVRGSRAIELTALAADFEKKMREIIQYLETQQIMTREQLIERMKQEIAQLQSDKQTEKKEDDQNKDEEARRRREQEEQIKNSVIDGTRAVMHRVEPGPFKMGEVGNQKDVNITKPFDMMAIPTTQIVWRKVADLAAQKLPGEYQIDPDPSNFKGDTLPVEQVSYEDIQTWTEALNELSAAGEPALADLIPGHKKGDVYRLPTEAEWEFVVRGRGQYNDNYHFGSQESQLGDYGWYQGNSGSQTHPVGQKKPLMIGGKDFYDMHGNVWEWVHDWYQDDLPGGVDPQGPTKGSYRVLRGGSWISVERGLRSAGRNYGAPSVRFSGFGFRLVRTAK